MTKRNKNESSAYKKQAWAALLLGISLILFLAVISYNVNDPVSFSWSERFSIKNWLGPIGAKIAYGLMQWSLGYPILVLPVLLAYASVLMMRQQPLSRILRPSLSLIAWALLISVYLALPEALSTRGLITEYYPSGLIGGYLAGRMVIYLSRVGAVVLIAVTTLFLAGLTLKIELVHFINFIASLFSRLSSILEQAWSEFRQHREERRQEQQPAEELVAEEINPHSEPFLAIEEVPVKPVDLVTGDELETPPVLRNDSFDVRTGPVTRGEPGGIQTTLDEILADLDRARQHDHQAAQPSNRLPQPAGVEVTAPVTEKELDYDEMVRESLTRYHFPDLDLLNDTPPRTTEVDKDELRANAHLLESRLKDFSVEARVVRVTAGPVITMYELQPATGVKVNAITNLTNDLALAMEARGIRIIAPIPGKAAVGIEIPNKNPQPVFLKALLRSPKFNQTEFELPLALGKAINGETYIADLTRMPHLLVAGATGSGKSVGINTIIMSLLYRVNPGKVKFVMIDPKKLELSLYRELRAHYLLWREDLDEEVYTTAGNSISILNSLVLEMERRYSQLAEVGVRSIVEFNRKWAAGDARIKTLKLRQLPYIVVLIDELADLMMVASKEVETPIARLAQMARAVGIHLILATQRPSVDVITGVIKANFPTRIAYQTASKVDSRTILDMNGAEQLLGKGDMLYLPPGEPKPIRLQNPFVSTEEVEAVINHIRKQPKLPNYSLPQPQGGRGGKGGESFADDQDPLFNEAKGIVVLHQQGSVSFLQRKLKIGYSRAARLMDELEVNGVVGPADGSKARQVLIGLDELEK